MTAPAVLLLDDGELEDIQLMLQEMAIPFARIRGGAIVPGTEPPKDLLIATPRRIDSVRTAIGGAVEPPIRVMVVNEDSNALRTQLRRSGFDYLVRRPVHAEALRLMLLHCCYKGEERRKEPRVAIGVEVSFRIGLKSYPATLVDLSSRGCRLLSHHRVELGKRLIVRVPEALDAGGELLELSAHVVHAQEADSGGDDAFWLGCVFEKLDELAQHALALIIEDHAQGPATLRSGAPSKPPRESAAPPAKPHRGAGEVRATTVNDRRRERRAAYSQTIPAFGERAVRVLVGRDLSVGGMRVERHSELWLGDRLQLAIYGEAGEEPMFIWGFVERCDGDDGLVIRFDPLDQPTQARLERLVASLPSVESLHDSEAEAMGTVLSEILLTQPVSDER
jgi:PilZ domain